MLNSQLDPFASREQILRTPDVQQPQQHHQTTSMSGKIQITVAKTRFTRLSTMVPKFRYSLCGSHPGLEIASVEICT